MSVHLGTLEKKVKHHFKDKKHSYQIIPGESLKINVLLKPNEHIELEKLNTAIREITLSSALDHEGVEISFEAEKCCEDKNEPNITMTLFFRFLEKKR